MNPKLGKYQNLLVAFDPDQEKWFPVLEGGILRVLGKGLSSYALVIESDIDPEQVLPATPVRGSSLVEAPGIDGVLGVVEAPAGLLVAHFPEFEADDTGPAGFPRLAHHLRSVYQKLTGALPL